MSVDRNALTVQTPLPLFVVDLLRTCRGLVVEAAVNYRVVHLLCICRNVVRCTTNRRNGV